MQREILASYYIPWWMGCYPNNMDMNKLRSNRDKKYIDQIKPIEKSYRSKGVSYDKNCKTGGWYF